MKRQPKYTQTAQVKEWQKEKNYEAMWAEYEYREKRVQRENAQVKEWQQKRAAK